LGASSSSTLLSIRISSSVGMFLPSLKMLTPRPVGMTGFIFNDSAPDFAARAAILSISAMLSLKRVMIIWTGHPVFDEQFQAREGGAMAPCHTPEKVVPGRVRSCPGLPTPGVPRNGLCPERARRRGECRLSRCRC